MDFLREALQRNRRVMEIRDIAILALRTLAILLIGFALAQPFVSSDSILMWTLVFPAVFVGVLAAILAAAMWSSAVVRWFCVAAALAAFGVAGFVFTAVTPDSDEDHQFDGSEPLHAVLLIDNSLSMGYEEFGTSLLEKARQRARDYIDELPDGSKVSVIALCGTKTGQHFEAVSKDDAQDALDRIHVVDRSTNMQAAVNVAKLAAEKGPELGRRIVLFSDQQARNWRGLSRPEQFEDFPEMQVVEVGASSVENTSISSLQVADGIADVVTPTRFIVELHHDGDQPRENVPVKFTVDDAEISKAITLEPGQTREVVFEYVFDTHQPAPGETLFVPVTVTIPADRLPLDDRRQVVVPVVATLPVVFVDQYSEGEESTAENRVGETKPLRKLLAPKTSRTDAARQLIEVRHVTVDQLNEENLGDARLAVVAGISDPGASVPLLRQFVQQGGQLAIAAGGEFNPAKWNETAWLDGAGILPARLVETPIGVTPEEDPQRLRPFELDFDSLKSHPYFQIEGNSEEHLQRVFSSAMFFKAVNLEVDDAALTAMERSCRKRIQDDIEFLAAVDQRQSASDDDRDAGSGRPVDKLSDEEVQRLRELRPQWLLWRRSGDASAANAPVDDSDQAVEVDQLVAETLPRVLARYGNVEKSPFLVERRIGQGKVLFFTTGLGAGSNTWNTLTGSPVMAVYDRILRGLIFSTTPARNHESCERLIVPLDSHDPTLTYALWRPGQDEPEMMDAMFVSKEQRGFIVENLLTRGLYRIAAYPQDTRDLSAATPQWEKLFSVNGSPDESQLEALGRTAFEKRLAGVDVVRWIGASEEISLAGNQIRNQNMWVLFVMAVLVFLLVELLLLALPAFRRGGGAVEGG